MTGASLPLATFAGVHSSMTHLTRRSILIFILTFISTDNRGPGARFGWPFAVQSTILPSTWTFILAVEHSSCVAPAWKQRSSLTQSVGMRAHRCADRWASPSVHSQCPNLFLFQNPVSQYHPWINADAMLDKCRVGRLANGPVPVALVPGKAPSRLLAPAVAAYSGPAEAPIATAAESPASSQTNTVTLTVPGVPSNVTNTISTSATEADESTTVFLPPSTAALKGPAEPSTPTKPRTDWFQTAQRISFIVYSKNLRGPEQVHATAASDSLQVTITDDSFVFEHMSLLGGSVRPDSVYVNVSKYSATVTVLKTENGVCWVESGELMLCKDAFEGGGRKAPVVWPVVFLQSLIFLVWHCHLQMWSNLANTVHESFRGKIKPSSALQPSVFILVSLLIKSLLFSGVVKHCWRPGFRQSTNSGSDRAHAQYPAVSREVVGHNLSLAVHNC